MRPPDTKPTAVRIRRYNSMNWVIESLYPSYVMTKGINKGKDIPPAWVIRGYYSTLYDTVRRLVDIHLEEPDKVFYSAQKLLERLGEVEESVKQTIREVQNPNG